MICIRISKTPHHHHTHTLPIKAYIHALVQYIFSRKRGYFFNDERREFANSKKIVFRTQVRPILKKNNNFACIRLFSSILDTESVGMFAGLCLNVFAP